jgi:hypothetical protein
MDFKAAESLYISAALSENAFGKLIKMAHE